VPRFLRFPVFGFFLREYNRYFPDFSFLIMLHRVFADEPGSALWIVGRPSGCSRQTGGGAPALQRLSRTLKPECKQAGENRQIGRQMRRETPVLTGVTETATGDIEPAGFCRSRRQREDND
jgi:hypothetical protein